MWIQRAYRQLPSVTLLARLLSSVLLGSLFFTSSLQAEKIDLLSANNLSITAEYRQGESDKPLLVFVHGFLQTREFSTVKRLADGLNDDGWPILMPNLSLGVSNRQTALACEALHLHNLSGDVEEIGQWIHWGLEQQHQQLVLIGHSAGSAIISAYLANASVPPELHKTLLISLSPFGAERPAAHETLAMAAQAMQKVQKGDTSLQNYGLSYCRDYPSSAADFLSYFHWSAAPVLESLLKPGPQNFIVFGSEDDRIEDSWIQALDEAGARVHLIEGANHFFDLSHEFDLYDSVEEILLAQD